MRKKFAILLIYIVFGCVSVYTQNKQEQSDSSETWKQFISKEGKFKILFPQNPEVSSKDLVEESRTKKSHRVKVHLQEKYFAVTYSEDSLWSRLDETQKNIHYDLFRNTSTSVLGAKLISEKELRIDGKIGREVIILLEGEITTNRIFIIDKKIYQIVTIVKESQRESTKNETAKFLDSFEIIK